MEALMRAALEEAHKAEALGEVPVGAVVVVDGKIIARGHNRNIIDHDPSAHAEMLALREAAKVLGNYRLSEAELYVTLEPCSMCAGAMLHARLKKVIFGAHDPKTGAAGGVVNLFALETLNHQTAVEGGVLADECSTLLKTFFARKRAAAKQESRMEGVLRTPDDRFANLPGYGFAPHYIGDLKGFEGLRLHTLDEGPREAKTTFLCLHGQPSWSYLYRKMLPVFVAAGHRVVAPDLFGFGRSDKPTEEAFYTFSMHRQMLFNLVERLDLTNVVLVVQDWGGLLGLTLPMDAPQRYQGLLIMNTALATGDVPLGQGFLDWRAWNAKNPDMAVGKLFKRGAAHLSDAEVAAYDAPFPDVSFKAGVRRFPNLVPDREDADGAALSRRAREFWQHQWQGRSFMAVGMQDPVLGPPVMAHLRKLIRNCPPPMEVADGGHFVQEWGGPIAQAALDALT
jgi:tRNA(adenine34) deaminase